MESRLSHYGQWVWATLPTSYSALYRVGMHAVMLMHLLRNGDSQYISDSFRATDPGFAGDIGAIEVD